MKLLILYGNESDHRYVGYPCRDHPNQEIQLCFRGNVRQFKTLLECRGQTRPNHQSSGQNASIIRICLQNNPLNK